MSKDIGRNEPCPCGSGKKYKKCCFQKENLHTETGNGKAPAEPQFRFEPGSYGDVGHFMPSIACMKQMQHGGWDYYFVVVNPEFIKSEESEAVSQAENDLTVAFKVKDSGGTDDALAMSLRDKGYISVDDFNIVAEKAH